MKLLQLNCAANWGSTGKITEGIGQAAMSRGWESYIAYGRKEYMNPSKSRLIMVGNRWNVYSHYAKARFFDGEGLGSYGPTKKLIRQINELSPDIIHLHNIHDHWLNYPLLFEYLAEIDAPVVWTFHDCWAFTGGCTHFENVGCFKWKDISCNSSCQLGHKYAERNIARRYEAFRKIGNRLNIITVSKWLSEFVSRSMFTEIGASIRVINNGIDVNSVFLPGNMKERLILGVSNVWPEYKGLSDFIKLRELLPADVSIIVVGLTQKQIDSLPHGIQGISRTSNAEELADLYRRASVFVNPTYNDSFPTVNLEALACGTPVVTYRTGGSPEAIDDKTGIVVEKGDITSLASSINEILDHPERYRSDDCRERAERCFNKDIQFGKYIDLYEEILSKTK